HDADRRSVVEADPAGRDLVKRIGGRGQQQQQHCRIVHAAGRITSSAPAKPTITALHRRMPTLSCNSGTESAVTSSGEVKPIAEAVASGTRAIATTNIMLLTSINSERPIRTAGPRVAGSLAQD